MFWADFFSSFFFFISILVYVDWWPAVLKTGPDQSVRPVQQGTGSQSGPVKTPKNRSKTGKPIKNGAKIEVEPEIKKNGLMSGSVFKTIISI